MCHEQAEGWIGDSFESACCDTEPELAILKTLGFSDTSVLGFVLAEAIAICLIGGVIGMGLATMLGFVVASSGQFPISVDYHVWSMGLVAVVVLAIAVGLLPALRAQRLKIVDALAGR